MRSVLVALTVTFFGLAMSGCGGEECTPNAKMVCNENEGVAYWVDSCNNQGDKAGDCDCGCNDEFTGCKTPCDCTPDCSQKCCGDNDCGGLCADECSAGTECNQDSCECEVPGNCADDTQNQDETDVDCGGSCPPCPDGSDCRIDGDCVFEMDVLYERQ